MRTEWKKQTIMLTLVMIMTTTIFATEHNKNNEDNRSKSSPFETTYLRIQPMHNGNFDTRPVNGDQYNNNDANVAARVAQNEYSNKSKQEAQFSIEETELEMQSMHDEDADLISGGLEIYNKEKDAKPVYFDSGPVRGDRYNQHDENVAEIMDESISIDSLRDDRSLSYELEIKDTESMHSQNLDSNSQILTPTEEIECAICYNLVSVDSLVQLNSCHRQFCMNCVKKHVGLKPNRKCPLCNARIVSINSIPFTYVLNQWRDEYNLHSVKTIKIKQHLEDPWGAAMIFYAIPFEITRVDANKQFDKLGVEVGWKITKINNTSLQNITDDILRYYKEILRRGDACTLTFNEDDNRPHIMQELNGDGMIMVKIEEDEYVRNVPRSRKKISKYIGVHYDRSMSRWVASRYSEKMKSVVIYGSYPNEKEAARASDKLARNLIKNGEKGRTRSGHKLNFADNLNEVWKPGQYVVDSPGTVVTEGMSKDSKKIRYLEKGEYVKVLEFIEIFKESRVRGRINDGWISLLDTYDGYRWAHPNEESEFKIVNANVICDIGMHDHKKSSKSNALLNDDAENQRKLDFPDFESKKDNHEGNILNFPEKNVEKNKKCESCDAQNSEDGKFCDKCNGRKRKRSHSDDEW